MIRDDTELDLTYALGEIQDIRTELDGALADRLEGIEARLAEVRSALALAGLLPGGYVFTES